MDGPIPYFTQFVHQFLFFLDLFLIKNRGQLLETVFRFPVQPIYRLDLFLSLTDADAPGRNPSFCSTSCFSFYGAHHFWIESPFIQFPMVFLSCLGGS